MKILEALQKKQFEISNHKRSGENGNREVSAVHSEGNTPPDLFADPNLKIGVPDRELIGFGSFNNRSFHVATESDLRNQFISPILALKQNESLHADFETRFVDPERVNSRLVAITNSNSSYSEEYRSLRTHILHLSQKQKLQSIVVASARPEEGKSITALNLAWLLAQTDGLRALIIDSDLRRPSLNNYLGIGFEKGLSHVLDGETRLQDAILRLEPSGLHLLPGGNARNDVAELISGPKFRSIMNELRGMFDFIIVDAPPLGIFTDGAVLINHADGALLVVRANNTPSKDLDRILEGLPRERMLGAVLNQSEDILDESYYSHVYQVEN